MPVKEMSTNTLSCPDYSITPPQANSIENAIRILLSHLTDDCQFHKISDSLSEERGKEAALRDYHYYINAISWLGLIKKASPIWKSPITKLGSRLIAADPAKRVVILREILLNDPIFMKINTLRREGCPEKLAKEIILNKLVQPDCPWRLSSGKTMSRGTAKRRLSTAFSWSSTLGIWKDLTVGYGGLSNDSKNQLEKVILAIEVLSRELAPRKEFSASEIGEFCMEKWPGWTYMGGKTTTVKSSVRRQLQHRSSDSKYGGDGGARTALGIEKGSLKDIFYWNEKDGLWSLKNRS